MTPEKLKLLQKAQLNILEDIHAICVKENLRYYMIGGTALGAVRHGGFIPWDVDIDIAMPRADYDAFAELCKNGALPASLAYHNFENTKGHYSPHALVSLKGSTLTLKNSAQSTECGNSEIFIDIFPLDTAPADLKSQQKQAKRLLKIKKIKARKRGTLYRASVIEKIVKKAVSLALTPWSFEKLGRMQDKEMRKHFGCESGLLCSMASRYSYFKQLMPETVYGKPTLIKFEDREFFGPENIEEYLTRLYKDYMRLPPEEERQKMLELFDDVSLN